MKNNEDKKDLRVKGLIIAMASVTAVLMTGCVAAVPVAVTPATTVVHPYPATHRPVAVAPVVRPAAPVVRAASPVGVGGTARRTSRRVTRRR